MGYEIAIQNSINYIENNLCGELKLNNIAKQSYFSEFYFHKLFHRSTGASVMEYVRKRRLEEAAQDLVNNSEKITDIAFKYQFSSEESFSRAFRKIYGVSPRKYRNTQNEISRSKNVRVLNKLTKSCTRSEITLSMAA